MQPAEVSVNLKEMMSTLLHCPSLRDPSNCSTTSLRQPPSLAQLRHPHSHTHYHSRSTSRHVSEKRLLELSTTAEVQPSRKESKERLALEDNLSCTGRLTAQNIYSNKETSQKIIQAQSNSDNADGKQEEEVSVESLNPKDVRNTSTTCVSSLTQFSPSKSNLVSLTRKGKACKSREVQLQTLPKAVMPMEYQEIVNTKAVKSALQLEPMINFGGHSKQENGEGSSERKCGIPWKYSRRNHLRKKQLNEVVGRGGNSSATTTSEHGYKFSSSETASEYMDTSYHSDTESIPFLNESNSESYGTSGQPIVGKKTKGQRRQSMVSWSQSNQLQEFFSAPSKQRHMSLCQKYAPRAFHEIVGQAVVTRSLKNALLTSKIASMYIFYGPRGTGKTSCARVFAMSLSCLSIGEHNPCGSCVECLAHLSGKTLNQASTSRKHSIRMVKNLKVFAQDMASTSSSYHCKAFILDDCDSLSAEAWSLYIELFDKAPTNVVFILCANDLEKFPPAIISRSQKFYFAKLKESEIVRKIKFIAAKERLVIEAAALKIVVASSNGSLQDAETTLDQLSLLGPNISTPMVQELIGLVPEEKLMDLLHFALSRNTVATLKSLKDLTESGIDPIALVSQLASLVTLILTRGYEVLKERNGNQNLIKWTLTNERTEILGQSLKILSETEKQLRRSVDPWACFTAALLQLASPRSNFQSNSYGKGKCQINSSLVENLVEDSSKNETMETETTWIRRRHDHSYDLKTSNFIDSNHPLYSLYAVDTPLSTVQEKGKINELQDIWQKALDAMHSDNLKQLLLCHGKLLSLSFCKALTLVTIGFSQPQHINQAERGRACIAHAFQLTLRCSVQVRINLSDRRDDQIVESFSEDKHCPSRTPQQAQILSAATNVEIHPNNQVLGQNPSNKDSRICQKRDSFEMCDKMSAKVLAPDEQESMSYGNHVEVLALNGQRRGQRSYTERTKLWEYCCGKINSSRTSEERFSPRFPIGELNETSTRNDLGSHFLKMREEQRQRSSKHLTAHSYPEFSIKENSGKAKETGFLCWKRRGHKVRVTRFPRNGFV